MMSPDTIAAIAAAITFLEDDETRDLSGLHRLRVGSKGLMTRGRLANCLKDILAEQSPRNAELEERVTALEKTVQQLDARTVGSIKFGGT